MAPQKVARPRRSASYYRKNPESYRKKLAYQAKYQSTDAQKERRRLLIRERRKRGIDGKGGPDVSHTTSGQTVLENPSKNRARNGSGNNQRLKKA